MKRTHVALALLLSIFSVSQAQAAPLAEYLADTLMLPARTAAIGSALVFTTPVRAARGAMEMAANVCPDDPSDALIFEYAAVPLGFTAGAIVGSVDGAGRTIRKAWDKPFSADSFTVEED